MSALGIASHDSGLGSRTMRNAKPVDKNMNRLRSGQILNVPPADQAAIVRANRAGIAAARA